MLVDSFCASGTKNQQLSYNYNEQFLDMEIKTFEDLDCWKAARKVRLFIAQIIEKFPKDEKYDLSDNIRRASRSITRNIAEGYGRHHHQENLQFCRISRGSLYEILDDLITAAYNKYIGKPLLDEGRVNIETALKLLNGYIRYLEKAKQPSLNSHSQQLSSKF